MPEAIDHINTRYLGYAYKALFTKDEDSNYVTMVSVKDTLDETIWNFGLPTKANGEYPIYTYLKNYNLVSKYSKNTYLNEWNSNYGWDEFIMVEAVQGGTIIVDGDHRYGVNWLNGDIVERTDKDHAEITVKNEKGDELYFKTAWHYDDLLRVYLQYLYKDAVNGTKELVGVDILDEADVAKLLENQYLKVEKTVTSGWPIVTNKDRAKTAYASLITFKLNDKTVANYGIFEEYQLGQYKLANVNCPDDGADKAGFVIYGLDAVKNKIWGDFTKEDFPDLYAKRGWSKYTAYSGVFEGSCDHGTYWISEDGLEPADGDYVIYSVDPNSGEVKIVKIIYDVANEKSDKDNFVATGVVRAYDVPNRKVTIGETTYAFDYNELKGNGLYLADPSELLQRANFTYLFKTLFNNYVTYVVVDGKLVYIELKGTSSELIVVDSYAGLSSDGYIVVNGYNTKDLQYAQFRIGSYNGWVKGDYYYYPGQAAVDAAFMRGTIYRINSYDKNADVYYVNTVALRLSGEENRKDPIMFYDYDDLAEKGVIVAKDYEVQLNGGYKKLGTDDWKQASSTDKYVLICNPIDNYYDTTWGVDSASIPDVPHDIESAYVTGWTGGDYAPIIVYVGKGSPTETWSAVGDKVSGTDATVLINVDFDAVVGFNRDQYDLSYVLFLTYDYETAAYDAANTAQDWYLLGASTYTARVFNFYNGLVETRVAVNKDLKKGYAYPSINGVIVNDARYDAVRLNLAVPGAYLSGAKYLFGHGIVGTSADILFSADKTSLEILSPYLAPAGLKVKGLTGGTSVFLVSTAEASDGTTKITEVNKISDKEFAAWVEDGNLDLTTMYFWYIHTIGGNTVYYIAADQNTLVTEKFTMAGSDALVVETADPAEINNGATDVDTALIKVTADGVRTKFNDVVIGATIDTLTFYFDDNLLDPHGFTITGEDHNAIFLDSFEFGDDNQCKANNWNTNVWNNTNVADEYDRVVGTLASIPYAPHGTDGSKCDLIQGIKIAIPGGTVLTFPTTASAQDTDGKYYELTTVRVNFEDKDAKDAIEEYDFTVVIKVAVTFDADGAIETSAITLNYDPTVLTSTDKAGDNTILSIQAQ